jgi:creatinine amidohydrolase
MMRNGHTRHLADLRAPQVGELLSERSVLIQPVGAIEQHGPHLPLSTDLVIAATLAERVVAEHGDALDLWLLPPLAYSKSDEHAWSPGTIWLSAKTMLDVLDDLGRCVATLPTKRLAFLNGHGGNSQLLAVANRELRLKHDLRTFLLHPGMPRDSGGAAPADDTELGMGVHGGRDETSVMLALRPDLVDMDLAVRAVPEEMALRQRVKFGGDVPFGWSSDDFGTGGVVGDPTTATAQRGEERVAAAVAGLAQALGEIGTFRFPADPPLGP